MLSKSKRVSRSIFPKILKEGKVRSVPAFSLRVLPLVGIGNTAVVVSKAVVKSAVSRNTLKRRWYGVLRGIIPPKGTYVFFLKKPAISLKTNEIKDILEKILK